MSERAKQPPAKQFILRQRASDKELLELYFQQDDSVARCAAINDRVEKFLKTTQDELDAEERAVKILVLKISRAKERVKVPVIAVMNPTKSEKTLFYPEDTAFENPIETVPMKPEDYELPLL